MPKPIVAKGADTASPLAGAAQWAAKRAKGKNTKTAADNAALRRRDAIVTPERHQHDQIEPVLSERDNREVVIRDQRTGHVGNPHRVVGTAKKLYRAGSFGNLSTEAGKHASDCALLAWEQFQNDFDAASFQGLKATDWSKPLVDGGGKSSIDDPSAIRTMNAAIRVQRALDAAGRINSRPGSALWHIVGLGDSIRSWAQWAHLDHRSATGYLGSAISVLVVHYGIDRR